MDVEAPNAERGERHSESLVAIEAASQILGLTHWGVRYRVRRGLLAAVRRRRKLFFEVAELLRALEAMKGK